MTMFSICIPAHNAVRNIEYALLSIAKQSFTDWEVIIVDDGSTDNLISYLNEQTIVPHDRLKCYSFESNNGPFLARRKAFSLATGKYIISLDSDDEFNHVEMLNRLTDVIKNQQPDVIFYNASTVRGGKEKWIDYSGIKIHDGWMDRQSLISFFAGSHMLNNLWQKAVKRTCLSTELLECGRGLKMCEDRLETAYIFNKARSFYLLDFPFYYYRTNPASTTHSFFALEYCKQQAYFEESISKIIDFDKNERTMQSRAFLSTWADDLKILNKERTRREYVKCLRYMSDASFFTSSINKGGILKMRLDKIVSILLLRRKCFLACYLWTKLLISLTFLKKKIMNKIF